MRIAAGAVLFLFSGLPAGAQFTASTTTLPQGGTILCEQKLQPDDGKHAKGNTIFTCTATPVRGCPIDMRVRHGVGGGMVAVDENGGKRRVFAPRLRLFLNDLRPDKRDQKIVSATVTVRGWNGKARALPAEANSEASEDMKSSSLRKTLTVNLEQWGEPGVEGDFRLPGFASASRVDLESVTYDDGSTWKLSGGDACRVVPDPLMLLNQ